MSKPVIGITGRRRLGGDLVDAVAAVIESPLDVHFAAYADEVIRAGGIPIQLPQSLDPADAVAVIDGLLISGGADVDPARYGADAHALTVTEPARDEFEFALVAAAHAHGIPVLGVCRGCQVLNVAAGGTLHQHVPEHARWDRDATVPVDTVTVVGDTTAAQIYGAGTAIPVNSLHHQTVDQVGDRLVVAGHASDGTVELLASLDGTQLGVQWHPEMMALPDVDPAFVWLVRRAAAAR